MKPINFVYTGTLLAALVVTPLMAASSAPKTCTPGTPTPESYKWDFRSEASQLLQDIRDQAYQAEDAAGTLNSFAADPVLSWQAHAEQLNALKDQVNTIGASLCRLEEIKRVAAPWQRRAIDQIAPLVRLMADNTEDAIGFLNNHQDDTWMAKYRLYTSNLEKESTQLQQRVGEYLHLARLRNQEQRLNKEVRSASQSE